MPPSVRANLACAAALLALAACGHGAAPGKPHAASTPPPRPAAGAATSLGPDTLPPLATMPPRGVAGSHQLVREGDDEGARCVPPSPNDTTARARLDALVRACGLSAAATREGDAFGGQQSADDPAERRSHPVVAGRCYRVVAAHDATIEQLGVVVVDGRDAVASDGDAPWAPTSGWLCAKSSGTITLAFAVGKGRGRWLAEIWTRK